MANKWQEKPDNSRRVSTLNGWNCSFPFPLWQMFNMLVILATPWSSYIYQSHTHMCYQSELYKADFFLKSHITGMAAKHRANNSILIRPSIEWFCTILRSRNLKLSVLNLLSQAFKWESVKALSERFLIETLKHVILRSWKVIRYGHCSGTCRIYFFLFFLSLTPLASPSTSQNGVFQLKRKWIESGESVSYFCGEQLLSIFFFNFIIL
jgi:hypothetical protein